MASVSGKKELIGGQEDADPKRIGILGICGWGGMDEEARYQFDNIAYFLNTYLK